MWFVYPLDLCSKAGGYGEADAVLVGEEGPAVGDGEGEVVGFDEDVFAALFPRVDDQVCGHVVTAYLSPGCGSSGRRRPGGGLAALAALPSALLFSP